MLADQQVRALAAQAFHSTTTILSRLAPILFFHRALQLANLGSASATLEKRQAGQNGRRPIDPERAPNRAHASADQTRTCA